MNNDESADAQERDCVAEIRKNIFDTFKKVLQNKIADTVRLFELALIKDGSKKLLAKQNNHADKQHHRAYFGGENTLARHERISKVCAADIDHKTRKSVFRKQRRSELFLFDVRNYADNDCKNNKRYADSDCKEQNGVYGIHDRKRF